MAKQPQRSDKSKSKAKSKGGTGKLIGRIVVYSVLAILIVIGLLDYRVKSAATATGAAWRDARKQALKEGDDLLQSQLDQYIQGSPTMKSRDAQRLDGALVDSILTYSWPGLIRDYKIHVGIGLGKDPSIEAISGPGGPDPFAKE